MKCERCKHDIPEFLFHLVGLEGDHPVLVQDQVEIQMDPPSPADNTVRVTATTRVQMLRCSEAPLPKPQRIFDWTAETDIETAVGEAIGAASVCWENMSGTGIFDSTRAKQIVDELVDHIRSKGPIYG